MGFVFNYHRCSCKPLCRNMKGAPGNDTVIEKYLGTEVAEGRVVGPLDPAQFSYSHTSPIGVIPKPHQPGK